MINKGESRSLIRTKLIKLTIAILCIFVVALSNNTTNVSARRFDEDIQRNVYTESSSIRDENLTPVHEEETIYTSYFIIVLGNIMIQVNLHDSQIYCYCNYRTVYLNFSVTDDMFRTFINIDN